MQRFVPILLIIGFFSSVWFACAQDLEQSPPGEAKSIEEIRTLALSELKARYPETQQTLVRRDAHAKAHGCVKAVFAVDANIPEELRIGTFSQPAQRFKALIRFSNGAFEPGADTGLDGRGMAIKIIDVEPNEKSLQRQRPPHDILMINYPAFFSPNVADYKDFALAGALSGDSEALKRYFMPGYNPLRWRIREAYIAYKIASQKITSPLSVQYYSMAPFQFGTGRAVKYSARPCASETPSNSVSPEGPDFLRQALWTTLSARPACFELLVQERKGDMEIENTLAEWPELISPFRRVGKIEILSGQADSVDRQKSCESLIFSPWNAPEEQHPLGGINRLRKAVYEGISSYRNRRNNVMVVDPSVLWDSY